MGLFSKKPKAETASAPTPEPARAERTRLPKKVDPAEFYAVRNELLEVRARLEASEQAKTIVEARLAALDATTTAIATNRLGSEDLRAKVSELEGQLHGVSATASAAVAAAEQAGSKASAASAMAAAPHQPATDPVLVARVEALAARVNAIPDTPPTPPAHEPDPALLDSLREMVAKVRLIDDLSAQLDALGLKVAEQAAAPATGAGPVPAPDPDATGLTEGLAAQIAQLAERIAANDATTRQAVEQVNTLEQRLSAVSTELANQVSELGNDIDGLAAHQTDVAGGTISDELIDSLKSAQVKLAAEQARYEITFRQDLAALAEQIRRATKG